MAQGKCSSFRDLFSGSFGWLCVVYFLFCWGENMWQFALGLYLVYMQGGVLRLAAIFGFISGGSILVFGGIIGHWVDKNSRLKAARVAVIIQDLCVAAFSVVVFLVLQFEDYVNTAWDGILWKICASVIVGLSIFAQLFGIGFKISLERDWFVVLSHGDTDKLARINSASRALDLSCMILAPIVFGGIMTHVSLHMAALVMVAYSLLSLIAKVLLIGKAYRLEPALARKKTKRALAEQMEQVTEVKVSAKSDDSPSATPPKLNGHTQPKNDQDDDSEEDEEDKKTCLQLAVEPFVILVKGWKVYARQKVVLAGFGLSTLYMTVLGFHAITTGYVYANGVSEVLIGVLTAMAGVAGIGGTILFPPFHRHLGLPSTGVIGYIIQTVCLSLAVVSLWLPGSPFDKDFLYRNTTSSAEGGAVVSCDLVTSSPVTFEPSSIGYGMTFNTSATPCGGTENSSTATISIIVFLVGITSSRLGLWLIDLTVTQLFQENVPEKERGIANGVQNSLNMLFEMIMYILVIFLPNIETFGILVILSFSFVSAGAVFFFAYAYKHQRLVKAGSVKGRMPNMKQEKIIV